VMDMLARGDWKGGLSVVGLVCCGGVLELGSFTSDKVFRLTLVVVMKLAVFNWNHVVGVLLGKKFLVLQRLHGCVVMVLVDLTVDGLRDVLMASGLDGLGGHGRVYNLLNVGVVAMSAGELADGGFR
jgi:hypothetical protein